MEKKCSKCNQIKPTSEFYNCSKNKDGLQSWCKTCMLQIKKNKISNFKLKNQKVNTKTCNTCAKDLPFSNFNSDGRGGLKNICKTCRSKKRREQYRAQKAVKNQDIQVDVIPVQQTFEDLESKTPRKTFPNLPKPPEEKIQQDNTESDFQEAKTFIFLVELFCSQVELTPEMIEILYLVISDMNKYTNNKTLKLYLASTISKLKVLTGR